MSILSISAIDKLWSSNIHLKTGVLSDIITEEKDADSNDNTTVPSYQIYKQATTKATSNFSEIAQKLIEITTEIAEIAAKLAPLGASSPTLTNHLKTLTSSVNDLSQEISGKATYWEATKIAGTNNYSYNGMIFANQTSGCATETITGLFLKEMNGTYTETVTFPDEIHLIDGSTVTSVKLVGFACEKAINTTTKKLIFPDSVKHYENSGENDIQDIVANGCIDVSFIAQAIKILPKFPSLQYLFLSGKGNLRRIDIDLPIYLDVDGQIYLESINCPNAKYFSISGCSSLRYINFENYTGKEQNDQFPTSEIGILYNLDYLNLSSVDSTTDISIHEIYTLTNNPAHSNPRSLILLMNYISSSWIKIDTVSLLIINRNFTYTGTTSPFAVTKILNLGRTSNETLKTYFTNSIIY